MVTTKRPLTDEERRQLLAHFAAPGTVNTRTKLLSRRGTRENFSAGAIAGIVCLSVVILVILAVIGWKVYKAYSVPNPIVDPYVTRDVVPDDYYYTEPRIRPRSYSTEDRAYSNEERLYSKWDRPTVY